VIQLVLNFNKKEKGLLPIQLLIKNNGFAAPLALKESLFVLIHELGEVVSSISTGNPAMHQGIRSDNKYYIR